MLFNTNLFCFYLSIIYFLPFSVTYVRFKLRRDQSPTTVFKYQVACPKFLSLFGSINYSIFSRGTGYEMGLLNKEIDMKWLSRWVAPKLISVASTNRSIPEVSLVVFFEGNLSHSGIFCIHLSVISLNISWQGSLFSKIIDIYSLLKCVYSLTSEC
jgi:hypothetical protein